MSFSLRSARAWHGHEVVDLAVGRLALHYAEENPDQVVAALDDKTEVVIRELEAQHKEARRSLRHRRDRARGPLTLPRDRRRMPTPDYFRRDISIPPNALLGDALYVFFCFGGADAGSYLKASRP